MAQAAATLQPKHWKALELWEEGLLSIKEISKACKISLDVMYDLFEGNGQKLGTVAHLFKAELDKITTRTASKVRKLVKDNKMQALWMMNDRLKQIHNEAIKAGAYTKEQSLEVAKIMAVLNKATPGVEIGSYHSLSVSKGMTPEELVHEFRRLTSLARFSSDGGRIPRPSEGREG